MIRAQAHPAAAAFVERLAAKARTVAEARAENARRESRHDDARWRAPGLLWPLFGEER